MLARVIAEDDDNNIVVETNWAGCFTAQSKERKLKVNDYFTGSFDSEQKPEIEIEPLPVGRKRHPTKLSNLKGFQNAEDALADLLSISRSPKVRLRVPPYRNSSRR